MKNVLFLIMFMFALCFVGCKKEAAKTEPKEEVKVEKTEETKEEKKTDEVPEVPVKKPESE